MGLMKRVYTHHILAGTPMPKEVKFNPALFGLEEEKPKKKPKSGPKSKKKAKLRDGLSLMDDLSSDNSQINDQLKNAEKLLGRKVTIEDITGKR